MIGEHIQPEVLPLSDKRSTSLRRQFRGGKAIMPLVDDTLLVKLGTWAENGVSLDW